MQTISLQDSDNGKTIQASVGDLVNIRLSWKPSSGYFWQDGDTSAGEIVELKHDGDDTTPGATVYVTFKFKIRQAGSINLLYARPWSETTPPAKWFSVQVTV